MFGKGKYWLIIWELSPIYPMGKWQHCNFPRKLFL